MVRHAQTNCLSVFDHFVGLVLKGLSQLLYQMKDDICDISTPRKKFEDFPYRNHYVLETEIIL